MSQKLKILELFSGFETLSNAFREHGHECFTIDWDEQFPSSLHADISKLKIEDLPEEFRHPDIVFAGTDCRSYSVAAISKHRRKNPDTGNLDPISEYAKFSDDMNIHVLELIKIMQPKVFIFENPNGFTYRKQTDFMSNINLHLKPPCKNGDSCHVKAPRGARTGLQAIKDPAIKAMYPVELCRHIVTECEKYINGGNKN